MIENEPLIKYGYTIIFFCIIAHGVLVAYLEEYLYKDDNYE